MSIEIITKSRPELELHLSTAGRELSTLTVLMHTLMAKRYGLHPTDWKCGELIARYGRLTAGELAELTGLSSGAITTVIDRLVEVGFVERERDHEDRRKVWVRAITTKQPEIMETLSVFLREYHTCIGTFSETELSTICKFYDSVITIMRNQIKLLKEE